MRKDACLGSCLGLRLAASFVSFYPCIFFLSWFSVPSSSLTLTQHPDNQLKRNSRDSLPEHLFIHGEAPLLGKV